VTEFRNGSAIEDLGIITDEEFEAEKGRLLGL
jgi:hypothetical protein